MAGQNAALLSRIRELVGVRPSHGVCLADLCTAADVLRDLAAWFDDYNRLRRHQGVRALTC